MVDIIWLVTSYVMLRCMILIIIKLLWREFLPCVSVISKWNVLCDGFMNARKALLGTDCCHQ